MAIAITDKIIGLLVSLSPDDIESLRPAERRRLADHCRHAAELAEPKRAAAGAGAPIDLRAGRQA
jgi:hypothetical protein